MFLSVVLYLSPNSTHPAQTVDGLLRELHSCQSHFSLTIVLAKHHTLSKELNLGHEGILFSVENSISIPEGLNEGLKFVNQSKIHTDYVCLFYDDFQLSEGYFTSILAANIDDIDNVMIAPNYLSKKEKVPFYSLNGVLFRYPFLQLMLGRLYEEYFSWEDYPYYYALARRFKVVRPVDANLVKLNYHFNAQKAWMEAGRGCKEKRQSLLYVLRSAFQLFSRLQLTASLFLIIGFFKGSNYKYPSKIIRKITLSKMKELTSLRSN